MESKQEYLTDELEIQATKTFSETFKGKLITVEVTVNSQGYYAKAKDSDMYEYRLKLKYEAICSYGPSFVTFEGYSDAPNFDDTLNTDDFALFQANYIGSMVKRLIENKYFGN